MKDARITPEMNDGRSVFVFGSNLAGRHGAGAALEARKHWGAEIGVGGGRTGMAYGIPTKDARLKTLPLEHIEGSVALFIEYAKENPELRFLVTRVGCGLAGYKDEQIAPMFANAPADVVLPEEWQALVCF